MRIGATDIRKRKRLFIGDLKPLSRGVAQVPTIKEKAPQIEDKQPQNENKAPINISAHKNLKHRSRKIVKQQKQDKQP